jgi:4-amino-4-deoxy-L-arabinose transferase-like glycosyltransferase
MPADVQPDRDSSPLNAATPLAVEDSRMVPRRAPGSAVGSGAGVGDGRRGAIAALWRHAPILVFALGAALRLRQYLYGRSLWVDEAFLSLNVAQRSFGGLVDPLGWDQTAPLLFLWLEKAAVTLFGVNEYALRLVPLLTGLLLIPAMFALGKRLLGRPAGVVAATIAALSPLLIRYANEADSYSVDALVTAVLAILTLHVLDSPEDGRAWLWLALAGAFGVAASTPSVFVLAGVGAALLAAPAVRRSPRGLARTVALGALWCVLFGLVYFLVLRPAASSEFLRQFFGPAFLDPGAPNFRSRLVEAVWRTVHPTIYLPSIPVAAKALVLGVAAAGLVSLSRRRGAATAALFALPFAGAYAAAIVEQYPIVQRTMLFAAPLLIVLLIAGGMAASEWLPRAIARPALILGALALTLPAAGAGVRDALDPWHDWDARTAVRDLERLSAPGEPVYVTYYARPGYAFYTTDWSAPDTARVNWWGLARSPRAPGDPVLSETGTGDPFARRYHGRTELAQQLAPGLFRTFLGDAMLPPRPMDWTDRDAARIQAHAKPYAWLLFAGSEERSALTDAIARRGGRIVYRNARARNMYLYRVRFE